MSETKRKRLVSRTYSVCETGSGMSSCDSAVDVIIKFRLRTMIILALLHESTLQVHLSRQK